MVYTSRIKGNADRRPQAFWGALIGAGANLIGGLVSGSQQSRAQRRALEEQRRLAQQQLEVSNQNQLASTLNNYALAQQSYDDKDYNLKYRIGGVKRLGDKNIMITDGGNAKRIGNNTYLLRGGSHEDINETGQTGIGINVGGNEIEAEGGEVAQRKGNSLRIYSAQPILGGISPAEAIMRGYNKDRVFNAQQRFKKNNGIKDDGSKAQWGMGVGTNQALQKSTKYGTRSIRSMWDSAKIPLSYVPIIGTAIDGYNLINNPSKDNGLNFLVGLASDLIGYKWLTKAFSTPARRTVNIVRRRRVPAKVAAGVYSGSAKAIDTEINYLQNKKRFGCRVKAKIGTETNGNENKTNIITSKLNAAEYLSKIISGSIMQGGRLLTGNSKDRGSSKHPYPSVSSKDFAGGNRSYPIPTKADAIDALRLAGLHGRSDVRSKVYSKYPELRKKADFGTWVRSNRNNNVLANLLYESGIIDKDAWRNMLRDIHTFTGIGSDPYNDNQDEAVVTPGFGIPNRAQILRNVQQANKIAQSARTSQVAQRTSYVAKQAKDFYRDLGINIPVGRSQTYNPAFRSSLLARNIEDSNKALQISLNNTHLPKGIRLTPTDQSSIGRTAARVINPREAELVKQGINISQSARNMTSSLNPFLYAERTPSQIRTGLNRAFNATKQGVKNAGQKVKDFGNKVRNSNTYRTRTGFEERYNPTLGAYEQYNTYKLKPWVKATAGAAGTTGVIGLGIGLSNTNSKNENNKTQLDAKGKPISPYIARPQEPAKPQAKKSVPARKDTTRTDTTKQVNKVVKRQVRTTPQYKGNTTKGNYQLHDGETKVINGVKYTRRGNTIINHKTNVGYIYDKNGNYTGQADYSKVGNFNQAFDAARAAGKNQFIYRAGKYNNYSTVKETNAKKEALNRRIGARRIAKRMGGLTNPPVERFKCGGHIRPKAGNGMLAPIYSYGSDRRRLPSFAPIDITPRAIPNFKPVSVPTNTKTPFDPNSVPFLGNQSTFKPATQDYIGLGIDTLAALGSGMFTRSAYNKMNFDYALPNYVDESPVAFDTTYHNEAQRANIERNRLNARNLIRGNTASAQTSLSRMQQSDVDAMMETNKLLDEKSNKEVELRNQNAANEQQVRARNAAARNQYYQNVAQIKNAAIEAKNNAELAKAQSIGADLSGLSQAWTNFAGSVESRYDNRQKEAIIAATAKDPAVLSNAVQFGYNFSPEVLAAIYNSTDDDNLKRLALSQLSTKNRLRYGIR